MACPLFSGPIGADKTLFLHKPGNCLQNFFSALPAHYLYNNDKLSINKSIECLVGFIGVAIVNIKGLGDFIFTLMGYGFIVISAFLISAATLYGKRISAAMDATMMVATH